MKAVRITSVLGKYREILRDRGVHSMLSTMVTGRLVVRKKDLLHNVYNIFLSHMFQFHYLHDKNMQSISIFMVSFNLDCMLSALLSSFR